VNVKTIQGLEVGTYKIKVISTSPIIESTNTIDINIGEVEIPVITTDKLAICAGTSEKVTLSSSSCLGGLLKWSNNSSGTSITISPAENITYTAVCSVTGCKESASSNGILIQLIKILATASNTGPYFEGELLKLSSSTSNGLAPLKYEWAGPNAFAATTQNPSILNIGVNASGTYSVKITDTNNCSGIAQTEVKVNPILANEISKESSVNIYPNPVREELKISFEAEPNKQVTITFLDQNGRIIEQKNINSTGGFQQEKLNTSHLTNGQYFLKINTSSQEVVKKVVIF
jgi:hypothetical protein